MLQKTIFTLFLTTLSISSIWGQSGNTDSLTKNMDEVVITATRTERKLGNVTVPVSIITQKNIQQAGSLRLNDILAEQTGLSLTTGFGAGVQMQGLNPDYTLILINGENVIGRTAGILDLNRFTVGNIKKIEIVKGPSSSLYGSEAMAGVINIITDNTPSKQLSASLRYGTYNTMDANINFSHKIKKLTLNGLLNNYNSDGFSIRPFTIERTVAPIWRITNQWNFSYALSDKVKINFLARYHYEKIKNKIATSNVGSTTYTDGKEIQKDLNLIPSVDIQFNNRTKSTFRFNNSIFEAAQNLESAVSSSYNDYFKQSLHRAENQTDFTINKQWVINSGLGYLAETVKSSRYDNVNEIKRNAVVYAFSQVEYKPSEKITAITGIRYDDNQKYASAFSPKLSVLYKHNKQLSFTGSIGRGFKAPDFRQLYLNFTNTAAGSYSVFGSLEAQEQINKLQGLGQIATIENDYYALADLKPEFSTGINFGINWTNNWFTSKINFFRNDIDNLIESRLVATYNNGAQIFSYLNVRKALTEGFEINNTIPIHKYVTLAAGYQFLYTANKDDITNIESGNVFTKDENGFARRMNKSDYFGLPNRSKHLANAKLTFEKNNFFANTRVIYRGKWAVADKNGNSLYDNNDDFAEGQFLINMAVGKQFNNQLKIQGGCDNLTNYSDPANLPNLPGRTFYITISYQFFKNKSN